MGPANYHLANQTSIPAKIIENKEAAEIQVTIKGQEYN